MIIRKLHSEDTEKLLDYLRSFQTECLFIYSNLKIAGIDYHGEDFQGEYFGAYHDDESKILGVIVHYWNGNLMVHARPQTLLESLCEYLKNQIHRPIAGIIGLQDMAQVLIEALKIKHQDFRINRSEDLFELDLKDLSITPLPHNLTLIKLIDAPKNIIVEWMKAYDVEALGAVIDDTLLSKAESKYQQMLELGAWVLLKDSIPVSICGFNAKVDQTCQVGPVWTPPEHRNKGYAKFCVGHALIQQMQQGYKKSLLFTNNPAAEKVYISLGFKKFNHFCLAFLKKELNLS